MNLVVRADAYGDMGTGHVMRCLALAQAWQGRGGKVKFITACESVDLWQRLQDRGLQLIRLRRPYRDPSDWEITSRTLEALSKAWLVLDGYHLDVSYQLAFREKRYKVMVIDDYGHLPQYHCNLLLNQNIEADAIPYHLEDETRLLLGPKFSLIRPEFLRWRGKKKRISKHARKILITMGGTDSENVTLKVLRGLVGLNWTHIEAKIVLGPANPHCDSILKAIQDVPFKAELLQTPKDMSALMAWADIAVTGGGSTCLELAFMGVPFLTIVLAENQAAGAAGFEKNAVAMNLGWHKDLTPKDLTRRIMELIESAEERALYSERGLALVDGLGANRVAEAIVPTELVFSVARPDDCELVWRWANDPFTRQMSFSSEPIPIDSHRHWFVSRIEDPECAYFIARSQYGIPLGQVRIELQEGETVISASIGSEHRGIGLGSRIIREASERYAARKNNQRIYALIRLENMASIRAFEKAGYRRIRNEVYKGSDAVRMAYEMVKAK